MDRVKTNEKWAKVASFFDQAPGTAVAYRLAFAQRETKNYAVLERELDLFWDSVQKSYEQKDWERLIAFREALQYFLDLRGYWTYSLTLNKWVDEAAKARGDIFNEARWNHDRADILNQRGEYREAEQLYQKSEEMYRSLGQDEWALKSRHMRSMVIRAQGWLAEAQHLCQTTIDEARELGLGQWLAHPLYALALLVRDQGNIQRAEALMEESLSRLADTDEYAMMGQCHSFLAEVALYRKNFSEAHTHLQTSLQLVQRVGITRRIVATQRLLGDLALAEGYYEEAGRIYDNIMKELEQLDDKPARAQTLFSRAKLMIQMKRLQDARQMLEGSLAIYKEVSNTRRIVGVSLLLIKVYIWQGQWLRALKLALPTFKFIFSSGLLHPRVLLTLLRMQAM